MSEVVYLLHFDRPYKHAAHYMGTTKHLPSRLDRHRAGHGSRLLEVITQAGIGFSVARIWKGGRTRERQLKRQGGHRRKCLMCRIKGL